MARGRGEYVTVWIQAGKVHYRSSVYISTASREAERGSEGYTWSLWTWKRQAIEFLDKKCGDA
jgi:hypothetical protein